jgi:CheY-like chemotaxis protein
LVAPTFEVIVEVEADGMSSIGARRELISETGGSRKFRVLHVDDDYNDRLLFASALEEIGLEIDLFQAGSGYGAIDFLLGQPPYDDRKKFPLPDLMLLDLSMPGMDGFTVLKHVRAESSIKGLTVYVFSNSNLTAEISRAYALGASGYHQKPARYLDLVALLRIILMPWQKVYSPRFLDKERSC